MHARKTAIHWAQRRLFADSHSILQNMIYYFLWCILFPLALPLSFFGYFPPIAHRHYTLFADGTVRRRYMRRLFWLARGFTGRTFKRKVDLQKPHVSIIVQDEENYRIGLNLSNGHTLYLTSYLNSKGKKSTFKTAAEINDFYGVVQKRMQREKNPPPSVNPNYNKPNTCRFCGGSVGTNAFCISCGAQM